jgi:hypothetical protein
MLYEYAGILFNKAAIVPSIASDKANKHKNTISNLTICIFLFTLNTAVNKTTDTIHNKGLINEALFMIYMSMIKIMLRDISILVIVSLF